MNTYINLYELTKDLERHEGKRLDVYLDTEGLPTVGIGHLLTNEEKQRWNVGDCITEGECEMFFLRDLDEAICRARRIVTVPVFDNLDPVRRNIVINMAFNLGNRLSGFKKMLAALAKGSYEEAADEMVDSKWYRQVKTRGVELVERMRSGR